MLLLLACAADPADSKPADTASSDTADTADTTDTTDTTETADTGIPATFTDAVLPLYYAACDDCHSFWGEGDADAVYAYIRYETFKDYPIVTPGDPENSLLYTKLIGTQPVGVEMPERAEPFSTAEREALAAWISDGALDGASFRDAVETPLQIHTCLSCHKEWAAANLYTFLTTQEDGGYAYVSPGAPEESLLYLKLDASTTPYGDPMPQELPEVSQATIDAIGAWIAAGAAQD